jgi:YidC/Oxa1 family membrane protein insertase
MEDRKNLFVIIFITFFVMVYVQWMFPQQPVSTATVPTVSNEINSSSNSQSSTISSNNTAINPAPTSLAADSALPPSNQQLSQNPQTVINTGNAIFTVNHLGARIQSVQLKTHTKTVGDTNPYEMVSRLDGVELPLAVYTDGVNDNFTLYTLDSKNNPALDGSQYLVSDDGLILEFSGTLPNGSGITKKLSFKKNSYSFDLDYTISQPTKDGKPTSLVWSYPMSKESLEKEAMIRKVSILSNADKLTSTFFSSIKEGLGVSSLGKWIAICDYYFIDALINRNSIASEMVEVRNGDKFFIKASGTTVGGQFTIFSGPKEMEVLKSLNVSLERSVDLGWFSFLAHPIVSIITFFYKLIGNYGMSIILLTLLIKLGFLPLTQASFKSMKAMQEIQPEVAALRERIKDPNVLNQELMGLYKKKGVNPLGGCLPILIQIPVFLGLYNALLNSIEMRHKPFALWINDLSSPERLELFGIGIPFMILLMGASMFWQQKTQPTAMDPQQQKIMLIMPFIFTGMFILHPMPSGLVLYWLVNNVISIVQQIYLKGHKSEVSPLKATAYASLGILVFGYVLTLI